MVVSSSRNGKSEDGWLKKMIKSVKDCPLKYREWRVSGGKLFKHVKPDFPSLGNPMENWKVVLPKPARLEGIKEAHEPSLAGHSGVFKTFSRVASKFYWPGMRNDISRFVRNCAICALYKPNLRPVDGLSFHPKPSKPWEVISSDLVGPFPRSTKGYSYVLVITDYLTKFPIVVPIRQATSIAIVREIEEKVFLLFGVPRIFICDNGAQYRSKLIRNLMSAYNVNVKYTSFYHARANLTERINRTLKTMLSIYASKDH